MEKLEEESFNKLVVSNHASIYRICRAYIYDAALADDLIVYAVISWKSYGFNKENLEATSRDFINHQLDKIKWQRKVISHYFWIYIILIWLALVMYIWEITAPGTALFRYSTIGICSFFMLVLSIRDAWKQKKRLARLDEMKAELESNFY